jgi:hypothetical protein
MRDGRTRDAGPDGRGDGETRGRGADSVSRFLISVSPLSPASPRLLVRLAGCVLSFDVS